MAKPRGKGSRKVKKVMGEYKRGTQKHGQPGQPGHDRDKDRQGQQQQEPGRNPQPGGGQGERSR